MRDGLVHLRGLLLRTERGLTFRKNTKIIFLVLGVVVLAAGACLQFEFDLKSGHVTDLDITASNRPDVKDALELLDNVKKGDLVIRDLGYYAFNSFINILKKEAFFISRLGAKTNVFEMSCGDL